MKKLLLALLLLPLVFVGCKTQTQEKVIVVESDRPWSAVRLYQKASPAVVTILSASKGKVLGQGSGFLVEDGYLITNAHVLLPEGRRAEQVFVEWSSGNRSSARILRIDRSSDLAALVAPTPKDVEPLPISKREVLFPGEPVAAIGSPFGEAQSLSTGIISAVGRSVRSLTDFAIEDAIQTDASINPGNSGGPLLDARGRVIGINQQIQTSSGGNDGVGYAVPTSALRRIILSLQEKRPLQYSYLGVSLQETWPELARELGLPAGSLLIGDTVPGGPADLAGLRGGKRDLFFQGTLVRTGGDAIIALQGKPVRSSDDLQAVLESVPPGEKISVGFQRGKKRFQTDIRLGKRPAQ